MSFFSKVKDIQDHLLKCTCKKVFIVSDFENVGELLQFSPSVWITPYGAKSLDDKRYKDCGAIFRCQFVISVAYYCPTPTFGGVVDRTDCEDELCGPLIEADECLCDVISCLREFNCEKNNGFKGIFDTLNLKEYFKPICRDGCIILRTLWERDTQVCF